MRKLVLLGAAALLASCNKAEAPPANDMAINEAMPADENVAMDANAAAPMALASINETTWEFSDPTGKALRESVDASGNYITQSTDGAHVDHGTVVMKDGKACFTSAMTKDGEMCWSDPMLAPGQSGETVNAKGEKLTIKRVEYVPMKMPA